MFRYNRSRTKYYLRSKSLISAGKINPIKWLISKAEAKKALKDFGVPIKEAKKIHCLKHQICISYWNTEGKVCCSFFSYRIFERWLKAVKKLIHECQTLLDWEIVGDRIEYDLIKFYYPQAMANEIWHTLKTHWYQLQSTLSLA